MANTPAFDLDAFGNTPMNCMTLIAGKAASATGHVLVGHNEDDGGHHGWVPPRDWEKGAIMPAEEGCALLPQVAHTLGYYWVEYRKDVMGLSNADGFVNERGVVIVSNSMGTSREGMENADCVKDGGIAFNLRRALAERALLPVIPPVEEFPYAIRVVSEVVSSNGSTSQGSICGSTLALMDAGVPIKAPVAGISCGLIQDDDGSFTTFIDIQGVEDFHGEMDFKVAGTKKGITAIQMDLKNKGLTMEIIADALERCRKARLEILSEVMLKAIPAPRPEVSEYAPKMLSLKIPVDKIREVIGSGGKTIQKICADTGAKVDIDDDGSVFISAVDSAAAYAAKKMVDDICFVPEVGKLYYGKVVRILPIGAFVEIAPGHDGMVHISKLENHRVEKVEDVLNLGDMTWVKFMGFDEKGRANFSRKDALKEMANQ